MAHCRSRAFVRVNGVCPGYDAWGGQGYLRQGESPTMKYRVVLVQSEEGYSVSCPALRGCHSQGRTKEEALENIRDAIREWLDAEGAERTVLG